MSLFQYFESVKGRGILATADADGKVDVAVYSRPYIKDKNTLMFIMADRLTHENLQTNPWAAYLFMEAGEGYSGKRLYLKKAGDVEDDQLVQEICRRCKFEKTGDFKRFVVTFSIEKVLPLVGNGR